MYPGSALTFVNAAPDVVRECVSPPQSVSSPIFKRLDVRKRLAQGIEPLSEIRKCVDTLKPGEGLAIRARFLLLPLIEKLRGENFSSCVDPWKPKLTHLARNSGALAGMN